jgi:F-type H+-transporting ATPase subunit b
MKIFHFIDAVMSVHSGRHAGRCVCAVALTVFFSLACCNIALAQQPAPASPQSQTSQPGPQGSGANAAFAPEQANGNQELAHVSNEAADQDPTEAFKYSAAVRFIAKITRTSLVTAYWICVVINFAVIAIAIVWFLKSSLPAMFRGRTQGIQKEMQDARRASEDAQRRLQDIEQRLSRMSIDIEEMQTRGEADARAEEARILSAIEEEKQKILRAAEQEVEQASTTARRDLQKYAAALAVEIAEKGIRVDADEDKVLVEDFTAQLSAAARRNGSG